MVYDYKTVVQNMRNSEIILNRVREIISRKAALVSNDRAALGCLDMMIKESFDDFLIVSFDRLPD